jgi:hypothetical protein
VVTATTRWCEEDRMGVEFAEPIQRTSTPLFDAVERSPGVSFAQPMRRAGRA